MMEEFVLKVEIGEILEEAKRYMATMCGFNRETRMTEKKRKLADKVLQENFGQEKMPFLIKPLGQNVYRDGYFEVGHTRIPCKAAKQMREENMISAFAFLCRSPMPDTDALPFSQVYLADSWETCFVDAGRDYLKKYLLQSEEKRLAKKLYITDTLAPGMAGMPGSALRQFFEFMDGDKVGISLLPSGMMKPVKSFAGIYVLMEEEEAVKTADCRECYAKGKNCQYCKMKKTVKINFVNEGKIVETEKGTRIEEIARAQGIFLETPCGGAGSCGKCKVRVSDPAAVEVMDSTKKLTEDERNAGIVMACQTRVIEDLDIYTDTDKDALASVRILSEGMESQVDVKPSFYKVYHENEGMTVVYSREGKELGKEEKDTTPFLYGVTIDIGTTTLVAALIDLHTGVEMDSVSALNPQCTYAQDVVSRIQYCNSRPDGLKTLYESVRDQCNAMIRELCANCGIQPEMIYEVVYAGNTTMIHLASNTDPCSLGKYPYTPAITGGCCISTEKAGLTISPFGQVYLPPIISSYVGGDITAGILSSALYKEDKNILFIDIGTNGEMVLKMNGKMTACSTAAGPAFEGMNITFGMRAGDGAIEHFEIDGDNRIIKTIGDAPAVGICGSGLFDITGELVRTKVIEKNGRFDKSRREVTKYKGKAAYQLSDSVYLTQMDIRQIQLAKSAIRAGIEAMIGLNEVEMSDIDEVYIAGSFGYHLRPQSLVHIGIIPGELEKKIKFIGNTSKTGGNMFLVNTDTREWMKDLVKEIQVLELSDYEGFENLFIQKMSF